MKAFRPQAFQALHHLPLVVATSPKIRKRTPYASSSFSCRELVIGVYLKCSRSNLLLFD